MRLIVLRSSLESLIRVSLPFAVIHPVLRSSLESRWGMLFCCMLSHPVLFLRMRGGIELNMGEDEIVCHISYISLWGYVPCSS
jgi:hypothetical protein